MADEEREAASWLNAPPGDEPWVVRLFSSSRNFVAFSVLGAFLAAVTLYVYGTLVVVRLIWDAITERLIEVAGVLLAVSFLAFAVERTHEASLLEFGGAVTIVIAALSLLLVVSHRRSRSSDSE